MRFLFFIFYFLFFIRACAGSPCVASGESIERREHREERA
jgi:hypothetical protein